MAFDLTRIQQYSLAMLSFVFVAFGQPAWSWVCGIIAAACGYALFFRVLLAHSSRRTRFWLGTGWFFAVQLVQLSWFISHPFLYIYGIYIFFSFLLGLQFGLFCLLITPEQTLRLPRIFALAALWTFFEWLRLFFFSGYTWNPAGLALTTTLPSLQMASIWGVFGLTFWVMVVNLLGLRAWLQEKRARSLIPWAIAASLPYCYGAVKLNHYEADYLAHTDRITAVLGQPSFPIEESLSFPDTKRYIAFIVDEWRQILKIHKQHLGKKIDLAVLPEFTVPFGTYSFVYPHAIVKAAFEEILGPKAAAALPALEIPLAYPMETQNGKLWMVNNAFWAQGLANALEAPLLIGLEDAEEVLPSEREYYSAALYFKPGSQNPTYEANRYEKRVLVPMGEYLPFSFCKELAAHYGIQGSFTCGREAKVFSCGKYKVSPCICYEETFGHLTAEGRKIGADMIINLTSDAWYPNSRLPQQHFDHARLRTVENGVPLLRSCNTGITGAVDAFGRSISLLGEGNENFEKISDSLLVQVPTYTYDTIYSHWGDTLILGICTLCLLLFIL